MTQTLPAPWRPTLKNAYDTSNFAPIGKDVAPKKVPKYRGGTGWCKDF